MGTRAAQTPPLDTGAVLDDACHERLNAYIERRFGLCFPDHRRAVLENRVRPRVHALGLTGFAEYCSFIENGGADELVHLAAAVTNNETSFFREREQFEELFAPDHLPALLEQSGGRLRFLSAGCSSGEEAYTLAFYSADRLAGPAFAVEGFDIDRTRVGMALTGECRVRSLQRMSDAETERFLEPAGPERFRVRKRYRQTVRFTVANLVDDTTLAALGQHDVVFCRNVLIYFSPAACRIALTNLVRLLRPGGLLFLGHAESGMGNIDGLAQVWVGKCSGYRRVQP